MYELKKSGKVFTSKFVGTGHSSYGKRIYRAAVSQRLRNTDVGEYQAQQIKRTITYVKILHKTRDTHHQYQT